MVKLLRDCVGSVLVEATLVFPLLLLIALGTVDFTYLLYDWAMANKAAFAGARAAIVADSVATGITNPSWAGPLGELCFDAATGAANAGASCPSVNSVCTPDASSSGTCSDGSTFNNTAFSRIFTGEGTCSDATFTANGYCPGSMKAVFPRLQRQNVQISYQSNGLGFVGRPSGMPMDVTVSIRCMTHDFYFIIGLMRYFLPSNPWSFQDCDGQTTSGPVMPTFATTLTSEDMVTD